MIYIVIISVAINIILGCMVKREHDHVLKLQNLITPIDPVQFEGSELWFDSYYYGDEYEVD